MKRQDEQRLARRGRRRYKNTRKTGATSRCMVLMSMHYINPASEYFEAPKVRGMTEIINGAWKTRISSGLMSRWPLVITSELLEHG